MKKDEILDILNNLEKLHPDAHCELNFNSEFELLVAVILSAQCTDKRVNEVTRILFKKINTPYEFAQVEQKELEEIIKPCGFYKNKAKHIIECAKSIVENFNGVVPNNMEDLITLPGVGRKTANVMLSEAFHIQSIAVDTHVLRVSNRIGLAKSDDPYEVEKKLMEIIPKDKWSKTHHLLIFLGRYTCNARKPKCDNCNISKYCKYWRGKCF